MDAFRLSSIRLPLAAISVVKLVKLFSNFENEHSGIIVVRYVDLKIMTLFTCSSFPVPCASCIPVLWLSGCFRGQQNGQGIHTFE